ncbi:MAG: response regulator transcription factor [Cyclobacteriaceae bacterium]
MSNQHQIKVVIADDHAFLLKGLSEHLQSRDHKVVGEATNGQDALDLIIQLNPDVAILDIEMPSLSGFSIADYCKRHELTTKIIILSFHKAPEFVSQAQHLGISGYLLKEDASDEILVCIESVLKGLPYFSKNIEVKTEGAEVSGQLTQLTPSELKILRLIAQAKSTSSVAELLFISERTVEKHRSNIVSKLGLSGQPNSLTNWAIERKSLIMSI